MNPAAQGRAYPDVAFTVDPERVAAFREVVGQREGVPPTFVTTAEFSVFPHVIADPELALDFTRVVHGSQEYEYTRALSEGEALVARSRIESIRERGGTGFLTILTELIDADGGTVCTARSVMVERS